MGWIDTLKDFHYFLQFTIPRISATKCYSTDNVTYSTNSSYNTNNSFLQQELILLSNDTTERAKITKISITDMKLLIEHPLENLLKIIWWRSFFAIPTAIIIGHKFCNRAYILLSPFRHLWKRLSKLYKWKLPWVSRWLWTEWGQE